MRERDISASAYVQAKRLCILGIYDSPFGPIPFSHAQACDVEDGHVDINGEIAQPIATAIDDSQKVIMRKIENEEVRLAAEELVDRTNAGDQNAAATMMLVRQNAQKGSPRAALTMKYMLRYAKGGNRFNGDAVSTAIPQRSNAKVIRVLAKELDTDDSPLKFRSAILAMLPSLTMLEGAVTLSNGPDLDKDRIESVVDKMNEDDQKLFFLGFKNWRNTSTKNEDANFRMGRIFGLARTIQLVRLPQTPVSTLSKAAGLELD